MREAADGLFSAGAAAKHGSCRHWRRQRRSRRRGSSSQHTRCLLQRTEGGALKVVRGAPRCCDRFPLEPELWPLPFVMPPTNDRVVVDHFGFELPDLTPEQASARRACHDEASKREAKTWAAIERDRASLPSHSELKKLARKVRARARWLLCFCSAAESDRREKPRRGDRKTTQERACVFPFSTFCSSSTSFFPPLS